MKIQNFVLLLTFKLIDAKIQLDVVSGKNHEIQILYEGTNSKLITSEEIELFGIPQWKLRKAVKSYFGRDPDHLFYRKSLPWGRIHQDYCWEQIVVLSTVKSARVKETKSKPVILATHDFDNDSNNTVKVNAGLSQSIKHTVRTTWIENTGVAASLALEFKVSLHFVSAKASAGFSSSYSWGQEEEVSETVQVKTTSSVEVELGPKKGAVAVLSANRGEIEVEVVYEATLRGNLGVSFTDPYRGHYYWGVPIEKVLRSGGIDSTIKTVGTIKFGFHTDAVLKMRHKNFS